MYLSALYKSNLPHGGARSQGRLPSQGPEVVSPLDASRVASLHKRPLPLLHESSHGRRTHLRVTRPLNDAASCDVTVLGGGASPERECTARSILCITVCGFDERRASCGRGRHVPWAWAYLWAWAWVWAYLWAWVWAYIQAWVWACLWAWVWALCALGRGCGRKQGKSQNIASKMGESRGWLCFVRVC